MTAHVVEHARSQRVHDAVGARRAVRLEQVAGRMRNRLREAEPIANHARAVKSARAGAAAKSNRRRAGLRHENEETLRDWVEKREYDDNGKRHSDRTIQGLMLGAGLPIARGGSGLATIAKLRRPK